MPDLRVQIVRFVDLSFPGWVEVVFTDAFGVEHSVIDKVPIFTLDLLAADSSYPQPGVLACVVRSRAVDSSGREAALITIAEPFGVEAVNGQTEFTVLTSEWIED